MNYEMMMNAFMQEKKLKATIKTIKKNKKKQKKINFVLTDIRMLRIVQRIMKI